MRGTRAYIASAGTAVVMLGASLCAFTLVSALVAFGSWPGDQSHTRVDQVLLRDVSATTPAKKVAVRADAVVVARRVERRVAAKRRALARVAPATGGAPVAAAPRTTGAAGTPVTASPATPGSPATQPVAPVKQQADGVTQTVQNTTQNVTNQVQAPVQDVQTQVNEVVGGVVGAPPDPQKTVDNVTTGVKNTAGSLLGG